MKILMVCLGNICRSPMAEGILRHKAALRGMDIATDSAGTSNFHTGEPPDHRAIAFMEKMGLDITDLRARQLSSSDFDAFDILFVMDRSNMRDSLRLAPTEAHASKVRLMLNEHKPGSDMQVPDPYYGGEEGFREVYRLLDAACEAFLNRLQSDG